MSWAERGAGGRCAGGATSVGTVVVAGTRADASRANERTGVERSWPVPCCRPHLAECDQKLVRPPSPYFWNLDCTFKSHHCKPSTPQEPRGRFRVPTSVIDHRRLPALPGSTRLEAQVGNSQCTKNQIVLNPTCQFADFIPIVF
jgi:hypothetical protein